MGVVRGDRVGYGLKPKVDGNLSWERRDGWCICLRRLVVAPGLLVNGGPIDAQLGVGECATRYPMLAGHRIRHPLRVVHPSPEDLGAVERLSFCV